MGVVLILLALCTCGLYRGQVFLALPSKSLLNICQINSCATNCKLLTISVSTMNESEEVVNKVFYDRTPFLRVVEGIP